VVAAAGAAATYFGFFREPSVPSPEEIRAYVATLVSDDRLKLTAVESQVESTEGKHARIEVQATFETSQPLFAPVDAAVWLKSELGWDATQEASQIAKASPRAQALAGATPAGFDDLQLIKATIPPGTKAVYTTSILATRHDSTWQLQAVGGRFHSPPPTGTLRSATPNALVVSEHATLVELKQRVAEHEAYLTRLAAAEKQLTDEARQHRAQAHATLVPGAVFIGVVTSATGTEPISVQFTRVDPTLRRLHALVRNEDSWHNTRSFDGQILDADPAIPEEADAPVLLLRSRTGDAISNGGAIVEEFQNLEFKVALSEGTLKGTLSGGRQFQARTVAETDLARYVAEIGAKDTAAAATVGNQVPAGTTVSHTGSQPASAPGNAVRGKQKPAPKTAPRTAATSAPASDPREAAQAAGTVVHTVRDVKSAVTGGGSIFDRALAAASAALSAVPKPDKSRPTNPAPVQASATPADDLTQSGTITENQLQSSDDQ
jgi:hypothetical protein